MTTLGQHRMRITNQIHQEVRDAQTAEIFRLREELAKTRKLFEEASDDKYNLCHDVAELRGLVDQAKEIITTTTSCKCPCVGCRKATEWLEEAA